MAPNTSSYLRPRNITSIKRIKTNESKPTKKRQRLVSLQKGKENIPPVAATSFEQSASKSQKLQKDNSEPLTLKRPTSFKNHPDDLPKKLKGFEKEHVSEANGAKKFYVCPECFLYFDVEYLEHFKRHRKWQCKRGGMGPPGDRVYYNQQTEEVTVEIFKVDPEREDRSCCFLDGLSRRYVVSESNWDLVKANRLLYYVLYVNGQVAGYFSSTKSLTDKIHLSVLLVLPSYRNSGFGKLLLEFSYDVAKERSKIGVLERPFTEEGTEFYYSCLKNKVLPEFVKALKQGKRLTYDQLSAKTFVHPDDIFFLFEQRRQEYASKCVSRSL